jgi:hypothetical protein
MLALAILAGLFVAAASTQVMALTDDEVVKAIDRAQKHIISRQGANGFWPDTEHHASTAKYGESEMCLFTLAYTDMHPNRDFMTKGLDAVMTRQLDYTYALAMRLMAYAQIQKKLVDRKRDMVRTAMKLDAMRLVQMQGGHGGWDYKSLNGSDGRYDTSNTQIAILALREAALAGVEIPDIVWKRTQDLYFRLQQKDGSWNYGEHNDDIGKGTPGYGSMTAAGLASIFITMDNLDLASGCPCRGTVSNKTRGDFERRIDSALEWLEKNFKGTANPKVPASHGDQWHKLYWLYSVERVGIAAGYKYFGNHNWFTEGAEHLVKSQGGGGDWGALENTCFALLFLYKGRAPILYNKLEFPGEWNNHRRDIANLTSFIEKDKEQMFHWQIVSLKAPVPEWHDAPILYITAETEPQFTDDHKKKLRLFTDTGGTILFEASCGNPKVRKYFQDFAKELWPEWAVKPLGPDHGSFTDPNKLAKRPEMFGASDGMRTFLYYSMDDISCPWQTKAYAGRDYLFKYGINLYTNATDHSPLRAKLAPREAQKEDRYKTPIKAGANSRLVMKRIKYDAPGWLTGRNYKVMDRWKDAANKKASISLEAVEEGTPPSALGDASAAYLAVVGEVPLAAPERDALKAYLGKDGFLVAEACNGTIDADQGFRKLAADMGWELKIIPQTDALLTGRMASGAGYGLISGVQFSRALRVQRLGRPNAEMTGIYQGGKLVGFYSPFDILYSMTDYQAYGRRGYKQEDAEAVALNVLVWLSDRPK